MQVRAATTAVDVDGNGKHAIVVRNTGVSPPQLMIGRYANGQFAFTQTSDPGAAYRVVALADLDGNGKADLVFMNTTQFPTADVRVWPDFQSAGERLWRAVKPAWDVQAVADFDGDGQIDLVWRYLAPDPRDTGVSYIWFNTGVTAPVVRKRGGAPIAVPSNWTLLGTGDFNSDGAADMVYVSPQNQIRVLMATGARTCANYVSATIANGYSPVKVADFLGSTRGDVLVRNAGTGQNHLISMDARGVVLPPFVGNPDDPNASCTSTSQTLASTEVALPSADPTWSFYAAGDFNGDGRYDIAWKKPDGTLQVWLMTADPAQPIIVDNAGSAPSGFDVIQSGDNGPAAQFDVRVANGYSLGKFPPGKTVHVWSAANPFTQMLSSWSGDAATLLNEPSEWHTSFIMPGRGVNLTANLTTAPVTLQSTTFTGVTTRAKPVYYYFPSNPRGIILFLHGTGGDATFISKVETSPLVMAAVQQGFGVVSADAEEAVAGDLNNDGAIHWDTSVSANNIDFGNWNALLAAFQAQGAFTANTPKYAVGMSNGGSFSIALGALSAFGSAASFPQLRFAAVASYCSQGATPFAQNTTTPTAWFMCANDDNSEVSNTTAQSNYNIAKGRGIAAIFDLHPASPLYDQRFARVSGVSSSASAAIAGQFRTAGMVNADGYFSITSSQLSAQIAATPGAFPAYIALNATQRNDVQDQAHAMMATHQFYSDWAQRTLNFFKNPQTAQ